MGTDDIFKRKKGVRKKRKENLRQVAPHRYLIVCEGERTGKNYFNGVKRKVEAKYKNKIDVKNPIELEVIGTGRNTESLISYAARTRSLSEIPYGRVWVVFDKDDFSDEQFNNAIYKAKAEDMDVAWSNEAFELWFLLHFEYLNSAIDRSQYKVKLDEYFSKHGINSGKYEKNLPNIFELLCEGGKLEKAIKWSEKLHKWHREQCVTTESKMNPCTTVYELVGELLEYID